jgi:tRNA/tmRNA/rRNA uracil-C5-methylase (TrmA/RlmC/RlmD family)
MVPVTSRALTGPLPGDELELTVGEAAHGGWCVARDGSLVVFVRHALPGERVRARITQVTSKLARADAVEILDPSPDRVPPPCPHARPGGCGGCDWQHASLPAQRRLKAAVIRQQLARIAGLDRDVVVEALSGDESPDSAVPAKEWSGDGPPDGGAGHAPGLGWRTRVSFAVGGDGRAGLRRHRSHEVIDVGECPIAHPGVTEAGVTAARWPGVSSVQVTVVPATGERGVLLAGAPRGPLPGTGAGHVAVVRRNGARTGLAGSGTLTQRAAGRDWRADIGGFWQVHPAAASTLAAAVLAALQPAPGDVALDLYCGAGLFAGVLAPAVGPEGRVIGIESSQATVRDARHNLRGYPWARVHRGDAGEVLSRIGLGGASLAVLDPPRAGATRQVIDALLTRPEPGQAADASGGLRRIAYVSCDPATLARDLGLLIAGGWALGELRGFDAFPMTHHVECLAVLSRAGRE